MAENSTPFWSHLKLEGASLADKRAEIAPSSMTTPNAGVRINANAKPFFDCCSTGSERCSESRRKSSQSRHPVASHCGILAPLPGLDCRPPKPKCVNHFTKNLVSQLTCTHKSCWAILLTLLVVAHVFRSFHPRYTTAWDGGVD